MPPWARSRAWNTSTMRPRTVVAVGPKRMAPRPTPVGWEQLPLKEGSFSALSTKAKAPHMARRILALGAASTRLRMERKPAATKGRHTTPQPMAQGTGSIPSAICMANPPVVRTPAAARKTAADKTARVFRFMCDRLLSIVRSFFAGQVFRLEAGRKLPARRAPSQGKSPSGIGAAFALTAAGLRGNFTRLPCWDTKVTLLHPRPARRTRSRRAGYGTSHLYETW